MWRAGIPYFQPVYGTRFGLKISKLYDEGNDDWLSMNGVAGEWAVGFHGINYPAKENTAGQTILESIFSGR